MVKVAIRCNDCDYLAETEVGAGGDAIGTASALGQFQAVQQRQHPGHAQGFQVTWRWEDSRHAMEFIEAILQATFRS